MVSDAKVARAVLPARSAEFPSWRIGHFYSKVTLAPRRPAGLDTSGVSEISFVTKCS
jgi:hypothetical protein